MPLQDTSQTAKTLQKKAQTLINFHTQNRSKQICGPRGTTPAGVYTEMKNYQGPLEPIPSTASTPPTAPGAPTTVTGVAGNTQVTVSWLSPLSNGGSPITGYIITSSPSAGNSPVTVGNVTTGIVTGLTNGTQYTFTVVAVNAVNAGPSSVASSSVTPATLPTVSSTSYTQTVNGQPSSVAFTGNIVDNGGATITSMGAVYSFSPNTNPTLSDYVREFTPTQQSGSFTLNGPASGAFPGNTYARTYATNSVGTVYGTSLNLNITICLAKGTLITLLHGKKKAIEHIVYTDTIVVWDFDVGVFSEAQPLWIKKVETSNQYNLLKFSDGTSLQTINQHRIFNKEKGMFTYPMTEDTPIGTTTWNDSGVEVTLVSKEVVVEEVEYYNVITNKHMNLFANGILTSCRYNNIYPIAAMKFVKETRPIVPRSQYPARIGAYYEGLRLAEQTIPVEDTITYIDRLESLTL